VFLAHGLGPAAAALRPWSTTAALVVFAAATVLLVRALQDPDASRRRGARALACALIAFAGLVATVASRPWPLPHRYFLFAAPALCLVYVVVDLLSRPAVARAGRVVLLVVAAAAAAYNTSAGLGHARARSAALSAFAGDLRAGLPPSELLARHQRTLMPFPEDGSMYAHDALARYFETLGRSRVSVFASLAPERGFRDVDAKSVAAVSLAPDSHGRPAWVWTLDEPTHVAGIRITKPEPIPDGPWTLEWAPAASAPFVRTRRYVHWWTPEEPTATVWIYDRVAMLRHPVTGDGARPVAPQLHLLMSAGARSTVQVARGP
jgi:hypothetical protein